MLQLRFRCQLKLGLKFFLWLWLWLWLKFQLNLGLRLRCQLKLKLWLKFCLCLCLNLWLKFQPKSRLWLCIYLELDFNVRNLRCRRFIEPSCRESVPRWHWHARLQHGLWRRFGDVRGHSGTGCCNIELKVFVKICVRQLGGLGRLKLCDINCAGNQGI